MKVKIDKGEFQPYSVIIRVESNVEEDVLLSLVGHDVSVPETVYGCTTSLQARTLADMLRQVNIALARRYETN